MRWKSEKFPLRHHAYQLHQHLIIPAIVIILPTLTAVEGRQDVLDVAVDDALAVQVAQPRQEALAISSCSLKPSWLPIIPDDWTEKSIF